MRQHCYLACDLGAESGRLIQGNLRDGRLSLDEPVSGTLTVTEIADSLPAELAPAMNDGGSD